MCLTLRSLVLRLVPLLLGRNVHFSILMQDNGFVKLKTTIFFLLKLKMDILNEKNKGPKLNQAPQG